MGLEHETRQFTLYTTVIDLIPIMQCCPLSAGNFYLECFSGIQKLRVFYYAWSVT
jgi:hypothetical protein